MTNNHIHKPNSYACHVNRLRPVSLVTALAFMWTFICLPLAQAVQPTEPRVKTAAIKLPALKIYPAPTVDRNLRKPGPSLPLFPYRQIEAEREKAGLLLPKVAPKAPALQHSLLNGVEFFNCPVTLITPKAWKAEMSASGTSRERLAQLHIWYGEWELAKNEQPAIARWHYRMALHLTSESDHLHGLAAYDDAMATFYEGAYREATRSFSVLANTRTALSGYSFQNAQGWLRHAIACAAYHRERSEAGIPEPIRLDPYCGAAGLAIALRGMGKPYDKVTIARACRITGQGSNLQDLIDAGPKLGLSVRAVGADDKGLIALPKPLIAHVEFDHFITVVKADTQGITYICSDCGPWPGGQVNLTWKQWHMLNPGVYGAIAAPGSVWDKTLAVATAPPNTPITVGKVASSIPLVCLGGRDFRFVNDHLSLLRGHIFKTSAPVNNICTGRPNSPGCPAFVHCPNSCPSGGGSGSAGAGDPVNLSTLEENYTPPADITVYNPVGPSIVWKRNYRSERTPGEGFEDGNENYQCNDYGTGWSDSYNVEVVDPDLGNAGYKDLILADGSVVSFYAPSQPSVGVPVQCVPQAGSNMLMEWDYSAGAGRGSIIETYKITLPDRSQMIFKLSDSDGLLYQLSEIIDRNGNAITLHYGPAAGGASTIPLLSSITNSVGTTLLTILRAPDGTGNIWSINDCYGRAVYYNVGDYNGSIDTRLLDHVSQVVPACTQNAPDRYVYGYSKMLSTGGISFGGFFTFYDLHSITVPSPTGTGSAQALINYDPGTKQVSSLTDANGNTTQYSSTDAEGAPLTPSGYTTVKQYDSSNTLLYQYTVGFDSNMSETTVTNGSHVVVSNTVFSDPNDPIAPSSVTDALGHTFSYTWDQYGHLLTSTDAAPRNTVTTYTYSYSAFPLGELMSVQQGTKQPVTSTYYEPSGQLHTISYPAPGTVGGGGFVTRSFTYDTLGNITSLTGPSATTGSTTVTLGYTTDGGFSQTEALNQPLTYTDSLGKTTHVRYDSQANPISVIEALGNESDFTYDIANFPASDTYPATGETGPGRAYTTDTYLYPAGPMTSTSAYDESGNQVKLINFNYGLNGESLSVSGTAEAASTTYDGLYRVKAITDGNGHTTHYSYNANGYLASVAYPNANVSTGYDIVSYPSYDANGDVLTRIDGRGVETDYAYDDPDNLLTGISYPGSPSLNASYTYDQYGRTIGATDGAAASASGAGIATSYDDDDRVTSVATTYRGSTSGTYLPTQTIGYTFNPDGSRSTMVTPAGTFSYGYDGDSRCNSLTNPFGETTSCTFKDNGWLNTKTLANGVVSTYAYNPVGQILDATTKTAGSALLSEYSIPSVGGYDGSGNLVNMTSDIPAASAYSGSTAYSYDSTNQLTQETSTRAGGYTNSYTIDGGSATGAGDMTSFKGGSHTYNSDNQTTDAGNSYDGEGNPTTYRGTSLTFDAEDRMTSYGTALTNGYFTSGVRAWKQDSSGSRTYFLYDGATPVCELDSTGAVTATNTFAGGVSSRRVGSTSTFYTSDLQGGNSQRLDSSANLAGSSIFDSYGARASTDSSTDPYSGYGAASGYYTDSETGLSLCTFRFYDSSTGRFVNRDPSGYAGGLNLYGYADNNPIMAADPLGLSAMGGFGAGMAVGGAVFVLGTIATGGAILLPLLAAGAFVGLTSLWYQALGGDCETSQGLDMAGQVFNAAGAAEGGVDMAASAAEAGAQGADWAASAAGDGASDAPSPNNCFIAGTSVQMADGSVKPIEKIVVGDKVATRNITTGKTEIKTVLKKTTRLVHDLVVLHFAEKKHGKEIDHVTATPGHPFYVSGKGFVLAGNLAVGNAIVTRAGPPVYVVQIDRVYSEKPVAVYNFTVQDDHTYFVGTSNGGEWVHNTSIWSGGPKGNSVQNAYDHWLKHDSEFPNLNNAKQYVDAAHDFTQNPPPGTLIKLSPNGDMKFYNPASNTFAVTTPSGAPRTMFKPTNGINYWNGQ